jgi:HK97 family phage major capsid protein
LNGERRSRAGYVARRAPKASEHHKSNHEEKVMNLTKARELREERARKVEEARAIYDKSGRTKEDETRFDAIMAEADAMKIQIDREERLEAAETETRSTGKPPASLIVDPASGGVTEARAKAYREAWNRAMKHDGPAEHGFRGITAADRALLQEFRDMGTGGGNALQGSGGGYFVPVGFVDKVEDAMKWYGDMLRSSTILPTATGQPLPFPTDNDTGTVGELVGEAVQVSTADLTLSNLTLNAYKYSTKMVKVSIELLQDSAFDLESYLAAKFAERTGRILNTHFSTGTGTSQPKGIVVAATAGPTAVGSSGNDGGSGTAANSIGSDDLIELEHSVDKAYRRGSSFMAHDSTIKFIKKLKDKYGRPLWLPGLAVNAEDSILGYPYFTNNDMAAIATTNKTVLFGRLDKYLVRKVKDLSVLRLVERFADYGQVAFIGFSRYDGNLLDAGTHPVKYLVQG